MRSHAAAIAWEFRRRHHWGWIALTSYLLILAVIRFFFLEPGGELVGEKVGGIAVHIGSRVAGEAGPGEVLVSGTVKDLVAGSGIQFRERGTAELKGVPGEWRLYAVDPAGNDAAR